MRKIKIGKRMFDLLSEGDNNQVVALSKTQVAKLYEFGSLEAREDLTKLQFANKVNNLLVKAVEVKYDEEYTYEMLVMERLEIFAYRTFTLTERKAMLAKFETELKQLHAAGFAHGDIKRPPVFQKGTVWDNICVCYTQIKLIDVGCSKLRDQPRFEKTVAMDLRDLEEFKQVFLTP